MVDDGILKQAILNNENIMKILKITNSENIWATLIKGMNEIMN